MEGLLKNIPSGFWDKIRVTNHWYVLTDGLARKESLVRKISDAQVLTRFGESSAYLYFTQPGLTKIKTFVNNDWIFPTIGNNRKPLKSLSTLDDIYHEIDGVDGLVNLGKALEASQIMRAGKFVSQEAFEFMVWATGNQQIDYETDIDYIWQQITSLKKELNGRPNISKENYEKLDKEKTKQIESLTQQKEQLNQNYQNLKTETKENKEGVAILRQESLKSILDHQNKLNLSEVELNSAYGEKDYRKLLQEANWEILKNKQAKNTVKNVLNILATKKAQKYLGQLKNPNQKITWGEIAKFLKQLGIINQEWEKIKVSEVLTSENNPFYLPIIQESPELQKNILSALDYCEQQQEQIENSRSQARSSLYELLFAEPPVNPNQLADPVFKKFADSISKLDSVEDIENFQKEMTEAINEEKQISQPQLQAQIIQLKGGNK